MRRAPVPLHRCLVDTSAYFAFADQTDGNHHAAVRIAGLLADTRVRLITTNFILAELHALLVARMNRDSAWKVLFEIDHSPTTVIRISAADERHARDILARYTDKEFSLTDATSFAVMERLGITHVFTFDDDFSQYGFVRLTPDLLT